MDDGGVDDCGGCGGEPVIVGFLSLLPRSAEDFVRVSSDDDVRWTIFMCAVLTPSTCVKGPVPVDGERLSGSTCSRRQLSANGTASFFVPSTERTSVSKINEQLLGTNVYSAHAL
jgi:hypothetical protein